MILTKMQILEKKLFATPLDAFQVNPHSVDLRLAQDLRLAPGATMLGTSADRVRLGNDVMGVVYPRSSTNRRNIALGMTGVVDAGYEGGLVLPLTNLNDMEVTLRKGERVASIVFHRLEEPVEPRLSKYHNGDGSYVADKDEEASLIARGRAEELKERFPLS
jgi:deoxycytidine triphosphate deaminase